MKTEKFQDMSNDRAQEVLTSLTALLMNGCENNGVEEPRFCLFVFNDPARGLMTTNARKTEVIRECGIALVKLMKDDVQTMHSMIFKIMTGGDRDDTPTPENPWDSTSPSEN